MDGYKFDLRIYALLTSCDPLRIYVYNDGLARYIVTILPLINPLTFATYETRVVLTVDSRRTIVKSAMIKFELFILYVPRFRFATSRYKEPTGHNTSNVFMHLTNYAVNKHSRMYVIDDEIGSKRLVVCSCKRRFVRPPSE